MSGASVVAVTRWLEPRSLLIAAVTGFGLYVVLHAFVLPGGVDLVAALPAGAQLGALLLLSTATRLLAGFFAARHFRAQRGLERRWEAVPTTAVGGLAGWLLTLLAVTALGTTPLTWLLLLDAVRWPVETALGGLLALPGSPGEEPVLGRP